MCGARAGQFYFNMPACKLAQRQVKDFRVYCIQFSLIICYGSIFAVHCHIPSTKEYPHRQLLCTTTLRRLVCTLKYIKWRTRIKTSMEGMHVALSLGTLLLTCHTRNVQRRCTAQEVTRRNTMSTRSGTCHPF
jgi:hypothetical protein